jgi:phage tail-like protein
MNVDARGPFVNVRFRVEIEGVQGTGAVEVIFPDARIVPGRRRRPAVEYGRLTLRRGVTTSSEWYRWWDQARGSSTVPKKHVAVVLMDRMGGDVNRWAFSEASPVAYSVSPLNALGAEPLIETLELSVGGFDVAFGTVPASGSPLPGGGKRKRSTP